ncbi:MAG: protein translocase subunit SecD [Alphaproteobacteria bacterium]
MLYFSKAKMIFILGVVALGVLFALPNVLPQSTVKELKEAGLPADTLNLGLDLQGGAYLVFRVAVQDVFEERLESKRDEVRSVLRPLDRGKTRIGYSNLNIEGDRVTLRIREIADLNEAVKRIRTLRKPIDSSMLGFAGANDVEVSSTDQGRVIVRLTDAAKDNIRNNTLNQAVEVVRNRIDAFGVSSPSIQRQGVDRIVLQVPGVTNTAEIKRKISKTAKMSFRAIEGTATPEQAKSGRAPVGTEVLTSDEPGEPPLIVRKRVIVGGGNLTGSSPYFDQQSGQWVVTMRFDGPGARRWANWTQENVGRRFAVVLDGKVISSPRVNEPILGGAGQIEGRFSAQSADELATLLEAGALPAELTAIEERTVNATLGQDSIEAGQRAAIIGFIAVMIYILLAYGLFGIYANLALIVNLVLIAGVLSLLQATLTLPGIAGIVLTIGMAVDANVLIFERIREEMRAGKTPINAVEAGYQRALRTILDANVTTFLAGIILFWLGSGPIRGFAVTLSIGIATSVFTAFVFTRFIVAMWLRYRRPQTIPI